MSRGLPRAVRRATWMLCVGTLLPLACGAQAPALEDLVAPFVDEVLAQLAKRQGFNRLAVADVDAGVFGTVYYLEEADAPCFGALREQARRGVPLTLNSLVQFSTKDMPQPRVISDWTSIRVSSLMTKDAIAAVSAKLPNQEASVTAMANALQATNAQVMFAAREVPLLAYQRAAREQLRQEGVDKLEEVSPQASGVITPFSQLIVQKFEFDRQLVKTEEAGVVASFLEFFGLRIAGQRSTHLLEGYRLPTNAVLAIKPGFVRFNRQTCAP